MVSWTWICVVVFSLDLVLLAGADDPTVDVRITTPNVDATIRGYQRTYGRSFRGIRYAQPPIGSLRFTEARQNDPEGLVEALAYGKSCTQGNGDGNSEDCLFLNVFTPTDVNASSGLPVYVWIHGGGFTGGSGDQGSGIYPTIVNPGRIVMVSINYRLGPFGFFSTRDDYAEGNWAVSDWIEALNWVQRYIQFFGGDPRKVTVGGQSSGAEAVSVLTITTLAADLFHQAILESGSAFSAAVMSYSEDTRNTSAQLAVQSGCIKTGTWGPGSFGPILDCLRQLTTQQIINADNSLPDHRMKWSIVQDRKYLPERLEYMVLKRLPRSVIIGDVHDEWLAWEYGNILNNLNTDSNTKQGLSYDLSNSYEMTYWNNPTSVLVGAENKYINYQPWNNSDHVNWMAQRIKLYSEMVFIGPVLRDAKYYAYTKSNVFLYSFDYLNPTALPQITQSQLRGVEHSWELQYIYDTNCYGFTCGPEDNNIRSYLTQAWVNFINSGMPTPPSSSLPFKWLPIDANNRYLAVTPNPTMQIQYHADSMYWACSAPIIDGYKPPYC